MAIMTREHIKEAAYLLTSEVEELSTEQQAFRIDLKASIIENKLEKALQGDIGTRKAVELLKYIEITTADIKSDADRSHPSPKITHTLLGLGMIDIVCDQLRSKLQAEGVL